VANMEELQTLVRELAVTVQNLSSTVQGLSGTVRELSGKIDNMDNRFTGLDNRMTGLEGRMTSLEQNQNATRNEKSTPNTYVWTLVKTGEEPYETRTLGLFSSPLMAMDFITLPAGCIWESISFDEKFNRIFTPIPAGEYPDEMFCLMDFYLSKTLIDPPRPTADFEGKELAYFGLDRELTDAEHLEISQSYQQYL
jgi:hypothetical protein